jgi:hypothetical protein
LRCLNEMCSSSIFVGYQNLLFIPSQKVSAEKKDKKNTREMFSF